MKTYASTIKKSLIEAGFVLHKCDKVSQWQLYSSQACIKNEKGYLMQSRALGDLLLKAAKEFNL
jgi:hypothetical protein